MKELIISDWAIVGLYILVVWNCIEIWRLKRGRRKDDE